MSPLTVLGIGNILMRDEGIGVHLVRALEAARAWPAVVEFVDGGVGGLNLLTVLERAQRLLVLDAAQMHLAPGEFRIIKPEQVSSDGGQERLSLHELPFIETLEMARNYAQCPDDVTIFAIQPARIEYGTTLSDELQAGFKTLLQAAIAHVLTMIGRAKPTASSKESD